MSAKLDAKEREVLVHLALEEEKVYLDTDGDLIAFRERRKKLIGAKDKNEHEDKKLTAEERARLLIKNGADALKPDYLLRSCVNNVEVDGLPNVPVRVIDTMNATLLRTRN